MYACTRIQPAGTRTRSFLARPFCLNQRIAARCYLQPLNYDETAAYMQAQIVAAGGAEHALVVGADVMSSIIDYTDRTTCVLFGDGAGAVVLEASDQPGLLSSAFHADGSHHGILSVPGQLCGGVATGDPFLRMDGQAVFKFAVRKTEEISRRVMARNGVTADRSFPTSDSTAAPTASSGHR
jgi:hypothetical protein